MELFKGQVSMEYLLHTLTYKEVLLLRDVRLNRLSKEREDLDRERKESERKQQELQNRRK